MKDRKTLKDDMMFYYNIKILGQRFTEMIVREQDHDLEIRQGYEIDGTRYYDSDLWPGS